MKRCGGAVPPVPRAAGRPHGLTLGLVVLAPPSRMESRGLAKAMLAPGQSATVHGFPHRSHGAELRAERITVAGKTVELR